MGVLERCRVDLFFNCQWIHHARLFVHRKPHSGRFRHCCQPFDNEMETHGEYAFLENDMMWTRIYGIEI